MVFVGVDFVLGTLFVIAFFRTASVQTRAQTAVAAN
jgi:hypothetical protein